MRTLNTITALALTMALVPAAGYAAGAEAANAAQRQDTTALRALVAKRANVNAAQPDGTTALHWAAHWNDVEAVKMLLKAGASPKAANRYGASPLSEAANAANAEIVKALLQAGADAKALTTADGETVLMTASRTGNVEIVRMLLDGGADVNAQEKYKGQTALMWAAIERHSAGGEAAARARRRLENARLASRDPAAAAQRGLVHLADTARRVQRAALRRTRGRRRHRPRDARRRRRHQLRRRGQHQCADRGAHEQAVHARQVPDRAWRGSQHCRCQRTHGALREHRHPQRGLVHAAQPASSKIRCRASRSSRHCWRVAPRWTRRSSAHCRAAAAWTPATRRSATGRRR